MLFQYNADFNCKSTDKATPLHDAAANGHSGTHYVCELHVLICKSTCPLYIDALQFLLECGADPNINGSVSEMGPSPLHFAVSNSHSECVEILLQYKCNINAVLLHEVSPTPSLPLQPDLIISNHRVNLVPRMTMPWTTLTCWI